MEMQLDEEEDMNMALALSQFQFEASQSNGRNLPEASPFAPFHCWEDCPNQESTHVTGVVCRGDGPSDTSKQFHLRPSVGTWLQPLPKPIESPHYSLPIVTSSKECDLIGNGTDVEPKVVEPTSLVSA